MSSPARTRSGFTLIEILIASVILMYGLLSGMALYMQCQKMMLASTRFETAQRVLNYFEMVHPIPTADQVTSDPDEDDLLNISEVDAEDLCDELELKLSPDDRDRIKEYRVERRVDKVSDDEELTRMGGLYTVRTIVRWGGQLSGTKPESETFVKLWRKETSK